MRVLTVNTGSSSLKLALFAVSPDPDYSATREHAADAAGLAGAASFAAALQRLLPPQAPEAIGHRIVAPLDWTAPRRLDASLDAELQALVPLAPDHLSQALAAVAATRTAFPGVPQVACSDSAFHATLPEVARILPLPPARTDGALRRYGYHGLSCEYALSVLGAEDPSLADGRIVIAHLGHGCSLTAVRGGRSLDTTMGFTPLGGLVMSTRSGELDPGVLLYLLQQEKLSPESLSRLLNHESGLLGISGLSGDMNALLASPAPAARLAVDVFVYQARKYLGAMAAVLGGIDLLVFTGGIGENSEEIRSRIAAGLAQNARVIRADEDLMIARHTARAVS
ncbi:MAG: acetate/propionate family kinase [Terriglobales bacterium]